MYIEHSNTIKNSEKSYKSEFECLEDRKILRMSRNMEIGVYGVQRFIGDAGGHVKTSHRDRIKLAQSFKAGKRRHPTPFISPVGTG
jgi:hypothetical protein